jgi:hypothetical protein
VRYMDVVGNYFYQVQFDRGVDTLLYAEDAVRPYKEVPDLLPLPFDALPEAQERLVMVGDGIPLTTLSYKTDYLPE